MSAITNVTRPAPRRTEAQVHNPPNPAIQYRTVGSFRSGWNFCSASTGRLSRRPSGSARGSDRSKSLLKAIIQIKPASPNAAGRQKCHLLIAGCKQQANPDAEDHVARGIGDATTESSRRNTSAHRPDRFRSSK
jgi:hypothetical protein